MFKKLFIVAGGAVLIGFIANRVNAARNFVTDLEYSFSVGSFSLKNLVLSFKLRINVFNPTKFAVGTFIPITLQSVKVFYNNLRIAQIPNGNKRIQVRPQATTPIPDLNIEIPINITTLPVLASIFKSIGTGIQLNASSLSPDSFSKLSSILTQNAQQVAKQLVVRIDLNIAGIDYSYVVKPADYLQGIGVTASAGSRPRATKSREQYYNLIPEPKGKTITITTGNDVLQETILQMRKMVGQYAFQTEKIAQHLKGNTIKQTCQNIFAFVYDHINYKNDRDNREELRTPSRLFYDGFGDCDCFSNFIVSILYNLNIKNSFCLFRYTTEPTFHHVYAIAYDENNKAIPIDPVLNRFDEKLEGITKTF